jgi:hypothetical protein
VNTFFVLIVCVVSLSARAEESKWFPGVIVLADGGLVMKGELALEDVLDVILFRGRNGLQVLPAHRIAEVRFYDHDSNINRHFISLLKSGPRRESNLYEVVLEGGVKVLRKRKGLLKKNRSDRYDYRYFVAKEGQLVGLKQFRNKIYPDLIRANPEAIIAYQRSHKLNPNLASDAILLIGYFNDLRSDRILTRNDSH